MRVKNFKILVFECPRELWLKNVPKFHVFSRLLLIFYFFLCTKKINQKNLKSGNNKKKIFFYKKIVLLQFLLFFANFFSLSIFRPHLKNISNYQYITKNFLKFMSKNLLSFFFENLHLLIEINEF